MVNFFKNDQGLRKHLEKIWRGETSEGCPLDRHNYMQNYDKGVSKYQNLSPNSEISKWAGILFIKDNKIGDAINAICTKMFDSDKMANGEQYDHNLFRSNYIEYVMKPEGIIYYMMKKEELEYNEANEIFTKEQCATTESVSKSTVDSSEVAMNNREDQNVKTHNPYKDHHHQDADDDPNGDLEIPDFDGSDSDLDESENEASDNDDKEQTEETEKNPSSEISIGTIDDSVIVLNSETD